MCKNQNPFIDVLIRQSSGDTLHSLVCFLAGGHQGLPQPRQGPNMKRTRGTQTSTHTGCWLNLTRCSLRSVNICPGVFLSSFIFSLYRSYIALSCFPYMASHSSQLCTAECTGAVPVALHHLTLLMPP